MSRGVNLGLRPSIKAIVERTVLRASRSFIGARLPPLFLHLPLEQTLEIDDCTEFALGQLLYERRAGKQHARSLPKNARECEVK